jgi:hypothetical protein
MATGDSHGIVLSIFVSKSQKWQQQAWVESNYQLSCQQVSANLPVTPVTDEAYSLPGFASF